MCGLLPYGTGIIGDKLFPAVSLPPTHQQRSCKSKTISRHRTLQPNNNTTTEERLIISLLKYHPSIHHVRRILLSNWSLSSSEVCTEVVKIFDQPPMITYKRDTNIRDMLVQSKQ